jgi:hypothetical protein
MHGIIVIIRGGLPYLLFWIVIAFTAVKRFIQRKRLNDMGKVCLCVVISALISNIYEFSWSYTVIGFCYSGAIAYLIQNGE